jgi:hypothetical protein
MDEIILLKSEDLKKLISDLLDEKIQVFNQKPAPLDEQRLYGDKQLSQYLACTVQTINKLKKSGRITCHRAGRLYYYLRSEIDRDLAQQPIKKYEKKQ